MATSNFNSRHNTSNIFAIGMECEDEFQFNDMLRWIKTDGKLEGFTTDNKYYFEDAILGKEIYPSVFDDELFELCFHEVITLESGYYQGAQIDFDISIMTNRGTTCIESLFDYKDIDEVVDAVVYCLYDDLRWTNVSDFSKWNKGLLKMNEKKVRAKVKSLIEEETAKLNEFCKRHTEVELAVSARFSNGETWYSKVD